MKVAIVYPFFAHYRKPIIQVLENDKTLDYHFIGGTDVNDQFKGLKLIDFSVSGKFIPLKNIWLLKYFLLQPNLIKYVKQRQFDAIIILADSKYLSTWLLLLYYKIKKKPVLFWTHGFRTNNKSLNSRIKLVYFNLFNGGFVYDNRAKDIFLKKGYKKRIDVVYNSLDFDTQYKIYQESLKEKNLFSNFDKYVVFSGRLTHTKRLEVLIDAIKTLKDHDDITVNIIFIGDGMHREILTNHAKESNVLQQVHFYGSCYDERIIANCFINSVACVIPSAVGLSAIHSLTYGTPVITNSNLASHGPEIESVKDGVTGKFFTENDSNSLSVQIKYFLGLSVAERERYRKEAISMISDRFNPAYQKEVFNKRLLDIFNLNKR